MPGKREWMRLGKALVSVADSAIKEAGRRPKTLIELTQAPVRQKNLLTGAATELTQCWASLEELLLDTRTSGFSDKEVRDLKRHATEARINALGAVSSFARTDDFKPGIYEPIYGIFREMAEIQVEVFDAVLRACDSRNPGDLDSAIAASRYCQSLGEQALLSLPELLRQHEEKEENEKRSCTRTGCIIAIVTLISLFGLVILFLMWVESTCEPTIWRSC